MGILWMVPTGQPRPDWIPKLNVSERRATAGPYDCNGGLVYAEGDNPHVGYYPDKQTWFKHDRGTNIVWGYCNEAKPTPLELENTSTISGHWITLEDGNRWLIPMAQQFTPTDGGQLASDVALPRYYTLGESGEWGYGEVVERYKTLADYADQWWDWRVGAEAAAEDDAAPERPFQLTRAWVGKVIAVALATNYRLTQGMINDLRIVTSEHELQILDALLDLPRLEASAEKKTTPQPDEK